MDLAGAEDSDQVACERLVEELETLNADLSIPSLSEADVEREHFERVVQDMAQAALDSGSPGFNPQPATQGADRRALPPGVLRRRTRRAGVQFPLTFGGPAESIAERRTIVRMANRGVR